MTPELKTKLLALRSIEHTCQFLQEPSPFKRWIATPVNILSIVIAVFVMIGLSVLLDFLRQNFEIPQLPYFPTILGVLSGLSFKLQSKMPKTLLAHMDELLTKYEAENTQAFQEFKSKCAKTGQIEVSDLLMWLQEERAEINRQTKPPLRFTK